MFSAAAPTLPFPWMTTFDGCRGLGNKAWRGGTQQPQSGGGRTSHNYKFITTINAEAWESCRVGGPLLFVRVYLAVTLL